MVTNEIGSEKVNVQVQSRWIVTMEMNSAKEIDSDKEDG
jgi:hypothetical protein